MKRIFLDTNFLMAIYQFKIDIFSEIERIIEERYDLFVLDKTIDELEDIVEKQKTREKKAAKFALDVIKKMNINVYKTRDNKSVDDSLVELGKGKDTLIATLDKELKKKLKRRLLVIRQKKYISMF